MLSLLLSHRPSVDVFSIIIVAVVDEFATLPDENLRKCFTHSLYLTAVCYQDCKICLSPSPVNNSVSLPACLPPSYAILHLVIIVATSIRTFVEYLLKSAIYCCDVVALKVAFFGQIWGSSFHALFLLRYRRKTFFAIVRRARDSSGRPRSSNQHLLSRRHY